MAENEELSPEELELQESMAALEAEEKAAAEKTGQEWGDQTKPVEQVAEAEQTGESESKPAEAETPEQAAAAAEAEYKPDAPAKGKGPVDAIVALRKNAQALAAENLLLQGQLQAISERNRELESQPRGKPEEKPAEVDRLEVIDAERIRLAEQADAGEISLAEMRRKDLELEREALKLQRERDEATRQPVQPTQAQESLFLESETEKLVEAYPILGQLTAEQLVPFRDLAIQESAKIGDPITPGELGTLKLRTRMAQLATRFYVGEQQGQQQEQTPEQAAAAAKAAAAAEAADKKLALQQQMPPDVAQMGSKGNGGAGMSEAELEQRLNNAATNEEAEAIIATMSPALAEKLGVRKLF